MARWMQGLAVAVALTAGLPDSGLAQVYARPSVSANADVLLCFNGFTGPDACLAQKTDTGYLYLDEFGGAPMVAQAQAFRDGARGNAGLGVSTSGAAQAWFEATPGVLRASTTATSQMTGNAAGFGANAVARDWGLATTSPGASFVDTLTVAGPIPGVEVPVTVTVAFRGLTTRAFNGPVTTAPSILAYGGLFVSSSAGGGVDIGHFGDVGAGQSFGYVQSFVTAITVGAPFQINAALSAYARALRSGDEGLSTAAFESMNTGEVFVGLPDGYTLSSASGHLYAPVPEPATVLTFSLGLLALRRWRR